jgi:TonB-dependent SusC/RagA subfamily outer membrane receptor
VFTDESNSSSGFKVHGIDKNNYPLVLVDGIEWDYTSLEKINPENIDSISIMKDKSATDKYGEKAKNGVILIVTKKK